MPLQFEWDARKAKANHAKHGVSFEEAITVFADPLARIFDDAEHSEGELREIIIGNSDRRALLLVSFVEGNERIRLISARKATRMGAKTMKKTLVRKRGQMELSREYRFDYNKSKPNRFAARMSGSVIAVVLEPDVAAVFKSSKAVNALLRSVISAAPQSKRKRAR